MPPVHYAGSIAAEDTLVPGAAIDLLITLIAGQGVSRALRVKNPTGLMYLVVLGSPEQTVQVTE